MVFIISMKSPSFGLDLEFDTLILPEVGLFFHIILTDEMEKILKCVAAIPLLDYRVFLHE